MTLLAIANIGVAISYLLLGVSADVLAIKPDYATPVWPAAGAALAFAIRFGRYVYPGIFLGALITNALTANLNDIPFNTTQLILICLISIGATVQAAVAQNLLLRLRINPTELKNGSEIIMFLLLAGPVCCLISSINGSSALTYLGIVPAEFWLSNLITWWVGDSVGVLVVTPFLLKIISKDTDDNSSWSSAVFTLGFLSLVIVSFFYMRELEQENRKSQVADMGEHVASLLQSNLREIKLALYSLKAFHESSTFVSPTEFSHYSATLISSGTAIDTFEWLPLVQHKNRDKLIEFMRQNGYPDFDFTARSLTGDLIPVPEKADYMPIAYAHPYEGNEKIIGLDVFSLPYRESQIRQAIIDNKAFASSPLQLIQEEEGQTAYILLMPTFNELVPASKGAVQAIVKVNDLMAKVLGDTKILEGVTIIDVSKKDTQNIIYGSKLDDDLYTWRKQIGFLNRTIEIQLTPTVELLKKVSNWQSYALLIGGLLYVAMLEIVLLSLLSRQQAIKLEVDAQTKAIAEAKQFAESASNAKTDFLASISHELRTPLNAIIGFTHRVINKRNRELDEQNIEALRIVEKNAHHLLGLINNLLDITKVEKGRMELEYNKVNLVELLRETAKHFSLAASNKKSEIVLQLKTDESAYIEADSTRMRQVMMNLVSNAIKFTSNGSITLRLAKDPHQNAYYIEVEDTGIGIASDDLPKLFNQFQKVGNTSRLNPQGTGLGLALSKEIVQLHGGRIDVSSTLNEGTCFTVWLPCSPEDKTNV